MSSLNLKKLTRFSSRDGPIVLIIMDGIGIGKKDNNNAFFLANTPFLDKLKQDCIKMNLYTELKAHGTAVGLPTDEEMGNSEVGHNALGAGNVVKQRAALAKEAIESKNLFKSQKWVDFTKNIINLKTTILFFLYNSFRTIHPANSTFITSFFNNWSKCSPITRCSNISLNWQ